MCRPHAWYFSANRGGGHAVCGAAGDRAPAVRLAGGVLRFGPHEPRSTCRSATSAARRPSSDRSRPDSGTLTATVEMTNVSNSAGMIIQHYDMRVADSRGDVYAGTTYFGFFSKEALANQVGLRDAKVPWPDRQTLMPCGTVVPPPRPALPRRHAADGRPHRSVSTDRRVARAGTGRRQHRRRSGILVLPGPLLPGPGLAGLARTGIVHPTLEVRGLAALGKRATGPGKRWR